MGNLMRWLCYLDVVVVLFVSGVAGNETWAKRKPSRSYILSLIAVAVGVMTFVIIQFVFNDRSWIVPKTCLLLFVAFVVYLMGIGIVERMTAEPHITIFRTLFFVTAIAYVMGFFIGCPLSDDLYSREITTDIMTPVNYGEASEDELGQYVFQENGKVYFYYIDHSDNGIRKTKSISANMIKEVRLHSDRDLPAVLWKKRETYYKTLKWGKEVEKKAPLFNRSLTEFVEMDLPQEEWEVKTSIKIVTD